MSTIAMARKTGQSQAPRRLTVDEYERIIAADVLDEPGRIELIDGQMVEKMAKSAEHCYTVKQALKSLGSRLPSNGYTWRPEQPVRFPDYDEPEPDVVVLRGSDGDYEHRIPTAADVVLLAEVSGSSLRKDRMRKLAVYARAGIPIYWIINLKAREVEVYSRPGKKGYGPPKVFKSGQNVPLTIGGRKLAPIAVDDLLPSLVR